MASSDDRIPPVPSDRFQQRILSQFQGDWVDRLNLAQMYVLIDGVLPFEACLYYQVLPLFLDGNRLNLGMVSPEDTTAADYVRRIISYLNYSLVARRISADALQLTLSAYLNESQYQQKSQGPQKPSKREPDRVSFGHHRHAARNRTAPSVDQSERLTLVVDSPDELDESNVPAELASRLPPQPPAQPAAIALPQPVPPNLSPGPSLLEAPDLPASPQLQGPAVPEAIAPLEPREAAQSDSAPLLQPVLPLISHLPVLQVQAHHLSDPPEVLMTLPPDLVVQELLARVLIGGIGRLYFENHGHYGRVLWSQNGVLQSVLESVPIELFGEMLAALKRMAKVSLSVQDYPKQVETEYFYERSRVLLRFRFIVRGENEEATLQILRGAALKFHHQQQMRKLERDAVGIARQLQIKLKEIRDRAQAVGGSSSRRFDVLPGLSELLRRIEEQLDELGISPPNQS